MSNDINKASIPSLESNPSGFSAKCAQLVGSRLELSCSLSCDRPVNFARDVGMTWLVSVYLFSPSASAASFEYDLAHSENDGLIRETFTLIPKSYTPEPKILNIRTLKTKLNPNILNLNP